MSNSSFEFGIFQPNPGRDASSLSPLFPFHSQYSNGLDINPGTRVTVDGNLNVPIMGWGMWDYKGKFRRGKMTYFTFVHLGGVKMGRPNTRVGFGSLNAPTNVLGISGDTIAALAKDGTFQQSRREYFYHENRRENYQIIFRKRPSCTCGSSSW